MAKPKILFLFSDTGGGHRSAAEAIIEAIEMKYGDSIETDMVDFFLEYAPKPLDLLPALYPKMVQIPQAWGVGYHLSNGHRRARLITASSWPYISRALHKMVKNHPSNLIVSVHPLANAPTLKALGKNRPPFITVVTDLVTTHALWYHRKTDLCLVPTDEAKRRALLCGLKPEQVEVVGLPVADRFCQAAGDKVSLRKELGWPIDLPVVLLVGGGEGMGPLEQVSKAICQVNLPMALVVIAGRNQKLKQRLESKSWPMPVFVYGFVRQMPDFMRAADILVTKAGPGTITEALNAGLPMLLYSRLPGQEDGNVHFIISEGAGLWTPKAEKVIEGLQLWLTNPQVYRQVSDACHRIARPAAAKTIADRLVETIDPQFDHNEIKIAG